MNLIDRVKAIVLNTAAAWRAIARETGGPGELLMNYAAVLAVIPAVADFIGLALIGFTLPNGAVARVDVVSAILAMGFDYAAAFAIVSVLATIIFAAAPAFDATRNLAGAFKLAVYSYTPVWLAGIFLLVPGLHFLVLLGLYGMFVLFRGMQILLGSNEQNAFLFSGAVTLAAIVLMVIVGAIRSVLFSLPGLL